jgi:hypothetical protein
MLHRTMESLSTTLMVGLEDLVADVSYARRQQNLGRLALLCYCELRPWARQAHENRLAELTWALSARSTPVSRSQFLEHVDVVIGELEEVCRRSGRSAAAESLVAAMSQ